MSHKRLSHTIHLSKIHDLSPQNLNPAWSQRSSKSNVSNGTRQFTNKACKKTKETQTIIRSWYVGSREADWDLKFCEFILLSIANPNENVRIQRKHLILMNIHSYTQIALVRSEKSQGILGKRQVTNRCKSRTNKWSRHPISL